MRRTPTLPVKKATARKRSPHLDDPDVKRMLRVQKDDQAAFNELMAEYRVRIFGHLYRLLSNRQDAEDLTQEVFLRLYRSRKTYQPRARFSTWLFHITQNVARNAMRTRRRKPCVRLDALGGPGETNFVEGLLFDRCEEPSLPVERAEVAERVRSAVSTLAGRQQQAVVMHQLEDRTYNEVAAEMAMTPEAAKSLLYRARNQLRECLAGFVAEV